MRRTLVLLCLVLCIVLCGCVTIYYDFSDILEAQLQSITICDISGAEAYDSETVLAAEPVFTLPSGLQEQFLEELQGLGFRDGFVLMPIPQDPSFDYSDYVVRFQFADGTFKLLSCGGFNQTFDGEGKELRTDHFGCSYKEWNAFIDSFLED